MRTFTSPLAFLLLAFGLCSLPWSGASPACLSEICAAPPPSKRSSAPLNYGKRDLTNAERLRKRLPLNPPPTRVFGRWSNSQPSPSPLPPVTYTGFIEVFSGTTSLGYVAPDPNYWTPLLTSDLTTALQVSFQLPQGATSGSQLDLNELNDNRGPLFGLVVGRDSTSSDIAPGSFNYLYLDPTAAPGTSPGATPQSVPSYFSTSSGLDKQAETSVWSVNTITGALSAQWINTDSSTPATVFFVQSNHLYAGGDANAFHTRYPAPVTTVTLVFDPIPTV